MAPSIRRNRVRELRRARELSQAELAAEARISRQSIGAIESGRATPAVDVALRIAAALGCTVEEAFSPEAEGRIPTERAWRARGERVALAHIGERWVSYPLAGSELFAPCDGFAVTPRGARRALDVETASAAQNAGENVVAIGCAPALGVLASRMNAGAGPGRLLWFSRSSTAALDALARGHAHLAGVHLVDEASGEENVADVRRLVPGQPIALITLARWEAGLLVSPGNPRGVRGVADLGRGDLRLVVREAGSGAQRLLERELRRARVPTAIAAETLVAGGHLEVARAIAMGAADAGVATRDAALAHGLDFQPLAEERYDLALPAELLSDARVQRLFDVMTSGAFRRELEALGYDPAPCGDRRAEIAAS